MYKLLREFKKDEYTEKIYTDDNFALVIQENEDGFSSADLVPVELMSENIRKDEPFIWTYYSEHLSDEMHASFENLGSFLDVFWKAKEGLSSSFFDDLWDYVKYAELFKKLYKNLLEVLEFIKERYDIDYEEKEDR